MSTKKTYQYLITLDEPVWPRKIAEEYNYFIKRGNVISVKDMQFSGHIYGDIYIVGKPLYPEK